MENKFKDFFYGKSQQNSSPIKWDIALLSGNYNPICKKEYLNVQKFIKEYVGSAQKQSFSEGVEVGLITNESTNEIDETMQMSLTFEERNYLTSKLFGLKLFPINFNEMFTLAKADKKEKLDISANKAATFFKENFHNANILVVLTPHEAQFIKEAKKIIHALAEKDVNVGFMIYDGKISNGEGYFSSLPNTCDMIKACCLMDAERPNPEILKTFAAKYKLSDNLGYIKEMHFKTKNDKYELAFSHLFPEIKLHETNNEDTKSNMRIVMEMIKKMYLAKI